MGVEPRLDYDDIVDHCCRAWNRLIDRPWKIVSIGMLDWGASVMISTRWYKTIL
ncbi:hypothetical protein [Rhizobium grahamii]|uniref:hypothetical protein n=1 Tax=Rhizobium grahamii TaxID=1120045 RepID=UPI0016732BFC|nr:hypothetical protein [Rhizobium grahamii]